MARFPVVLLALSVSACASSGYTPQPFPRPGGELVPPSAAPGTSAVPVGPANGYSITATALALRGAPYRNGGDDPSGFDCSGFVAYVFAQHGVGLPRTVGDQYRMGTDVSARALEAGDLVFFTTTAAGASHVGIALGGDEFVHAPSSNGEVRVERLSAAYWAARFVGARRVI